MKFTKMSLVTALLLGVSAYAADNVEVSGNANLFYGTQAATLSGASEDSIFSKDASYADFGFNLGATADLMKNVKVGGNLQIVSQLDMDKKGIAAGSWSNAHQSKSGLLNTDEWVSEGWIEGKLGNTTATIGRMQLQTPLAFTETWSVDYNTFEAALVTNEDLADTTLVGAYVAESNGYASEPVGNGSITTPGGVFKKFGSEGAYVLGATNNSFKPLTAQGWYYKLPNTADAFWLQADLDLDGLIAGVQYTTIDRDGEDKNDIAYAAKLGYAFKDIVTITAAYSAVDADSPTGVANMATQDQNAGAASSLYTEFWWWFQTASAPGATTMTLSAEGSVSDVDLFLGFYSADLKPTATLTNPNPNNTVNEVTFTAGKSFGPIDTSLALIYDQFDQDAPKGTDYNKDLSTVQVYLTYNY